MKQSKALLVEHLEAFDGINRKPALLQHVVSAHTKAELEMHTCVLSHLLPQYSQPGTNQYPHALKWSDRVLCSPIAAAVEQMPPKALQRPSRQCPDKCQETYPNLLY
eukprot:1149422-Pelagomonas_calceolata.AAC.16